MTVRYLNIDAKHRQHTGFIASMRDFTVSESGTADASIILRNPNISLYCLDDEGKRAIFIELPDGVNLASVPFVYQTQYDLAQRLLAVPYDTFRQVAYTLPPVKHLIMMYISGRSGSTLLSNVFNELDSVMGLSEPDVITQFVHLRGDGRTRDAELRELASCTVRILFKPNPYKDPATYALKFRMETVRAMDLFQETFPHAKNLYLYRDAIGFVRSFYRIFKNNQMPEYTPLNEFLADLNEFLHYDFTPMTAYLDPVTDRISLIQSSTLFWLAGMEWYMEQAKRGIPVLAVRYADLVASRDEVLTAIFAHCNLPVDQISKTLSAFERDAQAGTVLARENPKAGNALQLTDDQKQEMNRILARHPIIQGSDFIAPNTLHVQGN